MRGSPRDARNYELMTVLSPDVPEDEIQLTIERVVGYVTTAGGSVVDLNRDSPWGRRRLAYPIRHGSRDVRDGFYTLYHFLAEPHRVLDIERELKLNDRIMRYLLTQHMPKPVVEVQPAETAQAVAEAEPAPEAPAAAEPMSTSEEPEAEATAEAAEPEAADDAVPVADDVEADAVEAGPSEEA